MFFCLYVYAFTFLRAFHTLFGLLPAHLHELLSTDWAHSTLTFYVYSTSTIRYR